MALTRLGLNQLVNLASNVTGTLPAANGGTGASSFTSTKILMQEEKALYDAEQAKKASGKQKLKDLGLDDDEIKALMGA